MLLISSFSIPALFCKDVIKSLIFLIYSFVAPLSLSFFSNAVSVLPRDALSPMIDLLCSGLPSDSLFVSNVLEAPFVKVEPAFESVP